MQFNGSCRSPTSFTSLYTSETSPSLTFITLSSVFASSYSLYFFISSFLSFFLHLSLFPPPLSLYLSLCLSLSLSRTHFAEKGTSKKRYISVVILAEYRTFYHSKNISKCLMCEVDKIKKEISKAHRH